ncbi:hypothetical protein FHW36_11433 [Chitinophaga polysaccharea]|uniref:Lipoprotein n=1 Tax=Chitinophaga polysaccharea TaxID=1293035 RepID=A0A561P3G1_9BACT|nr:hypothetical protein FHW36_11433 [Chitinophaga polysaccharea]
MRFVNVINCFALSLCLFMSCEQHGKAKEIFNNNKERFAKAARLKGFLIKSVPSCYSFRFTYTGKSFWQLCDSVKPNPSLPIAYLSTSDADFLQDFMYDCDLRYIKYNQNSVQFIFKSYCPDNIVKTDTNFSDFKSFEVDSLFYLIPNNEKRPE